MAWICSDGSFASTVKAACVEIMGSIWCITQSPQEVCAPVQAEEVYPCSTDLCLCWGHLVRMWSSMDFFFLPPFPCMCVMNRVLFFPHDEQKANESILLLVMERRMYLLAKPQRQIWMKGNPLMLHQCCLILLLRQFIVITATMFWFSWVWTVGGLLQQATASGITSVS